MSLFEDTFEITEVNPDGKKFDKVSRVVGRGDNYDMELVLDVASQLYKLPPGQKVSVMLARTLRLDGGVDDTSYNQSLEPNLSDNYEYVMHGKVFKVDSSKNTNTPEICVYASFGGLLMSLKGDPRNLQKMKLDSRVYILMRKVD